jgi:hypothetical protein
MMHNKMTVEEVHAGRDVINIGGISQPLAPGPVKFSIESANKVTPERAKKIQETFVGDERLIDGALTDLEKHHILLLAGDPDCGMLTTAIYLGTRLAESTLVVGPLGPKVEIDLCGIRLAKRTLIFADGFHNHDLLGFFSRNGALEWEQLTKKLRRNKAYVIFTAEPDAVALFHTVRRDVPRPTPDLVGRGLDLRVKRLERQGLLTPEHIRQLTQNRERLIEDLKTLPRVAHFLDQFADGDSDLDAALQRLNDIPFWFSKHLAATDLDAWCFALTLALALVVRNGSGVGWYELERIRRAVTKQIEAGRTISPSLSDESLLRRARAEVSREPSRLGDAVRFSDRSYAPVIWQTLATNHRRVLTALIPTLRTIAEKERGPGSYAVRSLAAQMLGRIGELDPFSISIPLVQHWAGAQRLFIGRLLQGMRTSGNGAYRQAAIGAVDSLAADNGDDATTHDGLLKAISAYSLLGEQELAVAMEKLGVIAAQKLAPVLTKFHEVGWVLEQVEQRLSGVESPQAAEELLQERFRLGDIAERLSAQQAALLRPVEQAVVYLCLTADPVEVLHEMRKWIARGGARTATMVALLFLHDGIADDLEGAAARVQSLSGGERVHPIARSLRNSAGAAKKYRDFLDDMRTAIDQSTALSPGLRQELQKRLADKIRKEDHHATELGARTEERDHRAPAVADGAG